VRLQSPAPGGYRPTMSVSLPLTGWRLKVANVLVVAALAVGAVRALFRL